LIILRQAEYNTYYLPRAEIVERMGELDVQIEKKLKAMSGNEMMDYYYQQNQLSD